MIGIDPALALDSDRVGIVVRGLAVVGGAVLGGFLVGALVQGGSKLLSGQKVPSPALQLIRLLGAVATGWIVFLIVAGPGGSGFGGGGGSGILPGGGDGSGKSSEKESSQSVASSSPESSSPSYDPDARAIEVELLDVTDVNDEKLFRIKGTKHAMSFEELKPKLLGLKKKQMPKLDTVNLEPVGKKFPASESELIQKLKQWGDEEKITIKAP